MNSSTKPTLSKLDCIHVIRNEEIEGKNNIYLKSSFELMTSQKEQILEKYYLQHNKAL